MLETLRHVPTKKPPSPRRAARSLPNKPWAMLAYIGGDNNLSDNGIEDISEMCEEGSDRTLHVGIEIDTYGEHTGSVRYEISEPDPTGVAHRIVIERLPERNTGDPRTLTAFLDWGLERYKASNRLLVVWNHGSGFRAPKRDIAFDDFGSALDMPEVELALSRSGIGRGKSFGRMRIMGFDACLMCMLEIAHHFKDQTEYLVGSQQVEPGDGWPYDRVVARLKGRPSAQNLAKAIVQEYIKSYRTSGEQNVTQSAVDTVKTVPAVLALNDLGVALNAVLLEHRSDIAKARGRAQAFEYADYVDLIHLAELLSNSLGDRKVKSAANRVIYTTQAAIVANATYGKVVKDANGLSVWFPATRDLYAQNRAKYLGLHCNEVRKDWVGFLDAYFG